MRVVGKVVLLIQQRGDLRPALRPPSPPREGSSPLTGSMVGEVVYMYDNFDGCRNNLTQDRLCEDMEHLVLFDFYNIGTIAWLSLYVRWKTIAIRLTSIFVEVPQKLMSINIRSRDI
jgi:hypothetical protein